MCGRTSLFTPQPTLEERFDATAAHPIRPRYNVPPGDDLAVVTNEAPETIDLYEWGLVPHWADDPGAIHRPINARAETLANKPMFRDALDRRRALVLVDGYYEWLERRDDTKQPYRIARQDGEPFALAGLWERWENGSVHETVTIVTTAANDRIRPIHDRMPVVLPRDREDEWLDRGNAGSVLGPYPLDGLTAYPVSTAVNDPANDDPTIVDPIDPDRTGQTGLDEFA